MVGTKIKNFLLYGGTNRENFDTIRPMLWARNVKAITITAFLSGGIGAIFLIMNLILGSSVILPYIFLLCGSVVTLVILKIFSIKGIKSRTPRVVLCYAHMILVCVYAGILSTQESNYNTPATSVIVFIALLPLAIDDRPLRMYLVMIMETAAYLLVSYFLKSPQAFSLDILNAVTFSVVGMVLYGVICARNIREMYQSVRVEKIQRSIITSLAAVVEERDESTGYHIQRTEDYVGKLLKKMKNDPAFSALTKDYCNNVVLAAPMHDIGKIKISDTILNKPGKLTPEEFAIMKKHSAYGGEIIRKTISDVEEKDYCDIAYNIARFHHERYDGTGYPDGLKGEDIPLEARVMALADVYDALVSERCYKKAFTKEEAIKIIKEGSGTQFDPNLVPMFLECVK